MNLQPFQQRVVKEKEELDEKISKLEVFKTLDTFSNLPVYEQQLLDIQCDAMKVYSKSLGLRIAKFAS